MVKKTVVQKLWYEKEILNEGKGDEAEGRSGIRVNKGRKRRDRLELKTQRAQEGNGRKVVQSRLEYGSGKE